MLLTQVRFPSVATSADSLLVSVHPCMQSHALTSVCNVYDPVVYVRVQWIMETLKHPVCIPGWVAQPCRSWLSLGKATQIPHGRNPTGTIQMLKKKFKKVTKKKVLKYALPQQHTLVSSVMQVTERCPHL